MCSVLRTRCALSGTNLPAAATTGLPEQIWQVASRSLVSSSLSFHINSRPFRALDSPHALESGFVSSISAVHVMGLDASLQCGQCNCRRNPVELHLTRKWKTSRNLNRSVAVRKHETWFSKLLTSDPAAQVSPDPAPSTASNASSPSSDASSCVGFRRVGLCVSGTDVACDATLRPVLTYDVTLAMLLPGFARKQLAH